MKKRTSFKPGDVVLRREHGLKNGMAMGHATVLRLKVKSNLPMKTDEYQKVRFVFDGCDPTKKRNQRVGDLHFADYIGKNTSPQIKEYLKRYAKVDRERDKVAAKEASIAKKASKVAESLTPEVRAALRKLI